MRECSPVQAGLVAPNGQACPIVVARKRPSNGINSRCWSGCSSPRWCVRRRSRIDPGGSTHRRLLDRAHRRLRPRRSSTSNRSCTSTTSPCTQSLITTESPIITRGQSLLCRFTTSSSSNGDPRRLHPNSSFTEISRLRRRLLAPAKPS
uniref:Uncharacterized protein n=1 Tax=Steinernema glaseri TaxID=37863 RepID=A0A1I7ZM25_9BILA